MATEESNGKFKLLREVSTECYTLGESYAYAYITYPQTTRPIEMVPQKNDGMTMMLVKQGELNIEINMQRFTVGPNSFVVLPHRVMVNILGVDTPDLELFVLSFSTEFLHSVNINFSAISIPSFVDRQSPAQTFTDEECAQILRYFDLLKRNAQSKVNESIEKNIAASLLAAMVYQLVGFHYKRIGTTAADKGQRSCRNAYVHDFIKLVHVHYSSERSVKFYAEKLCISPKYLSLLTKETTGKSAAQWIDDFVLMEAKNLLRFSGKNVQQVAYALNFSNQSSFGKYFKHMTGQSPTEYQKS